MTNENLTGKWTGTIIYGKEYRQFRGSELFFDLDLVHYKDEVAGVAIDTGGTGMSPDNANILGIYRNNKIDFIKQYESFHYMSNEGPKIDRTRRGPEIKYSGIYNPMEQSFSGIWIIRMTVLLFRLLPVPVKSTGTWTMKRK
jgi:hypothetical protein